MSSQHAARPLLIEEERLPCSQIWCFKKPLLNWRGGKFDVFSFTLLLVALLYGLVFFKMFLIARMWCINCRFFTRFGSFIKASCNIKRLQRTLLSTSCFFPLMLFCSVKIKPFVRQCHRKNSDKSPSTHYSRYSWEKISDMASMIQMFARFYCWFDGGHYSPPTCTVHTISKHKSAPVSRKSRNFVGAYSANNKFSTLFTYFKILYFFVWETDVLYLPHSDMCVCEITTLLAESEQQQ